MIRVILADDHPPFRAGIIQGLQEARDIRVVGEAGNGPELLSLLARISAEVLLLDIRMPDFEIYRVVPQLRAHYPRMRILIVTAHDDRSYIHRLIDLGIEGFMLKDEALSTYARAIRDVAGGGMYFSPHVARVALANNGSGRIVLSTREYEVLRLVATGLTSVAIGSRLCIAPKTVDTYAERACQKLGASNRAAAVARAVELGLISADADE